MSLNYDYGESGMESSTKAQQDPNKPVTGPCEPDDGWWAAVLSDEDKSAVDAEFLMPLPDDGGLPFATRSSGNVNWDYVKKVFENDEIVTLNVVSHNRGGILVSGKDIHGFVPASHLIDLPADLNEDEKDQYLISYIGRNVCLKVIECDPDNDRIVFSERAALAKEGQRQYLLSCLEVGDIVTGVVTNLTSFGAFVDLGGLEGLIHLSELSWGRVQEPSDVLNVGEEIEVMVLQVNEEQSRIALSLKRLDQNPWNVISEKLSPGDVVEAVISKIVRYGAFARLEEGVEGLIHISSMSLPKACRRIEEFLHQGQTVKVSILHIDPKKRRLGLKLEGIEV